LYKAKLGQVAYTPLSVVNELRQLAHLSLWLEGRGVGVEGLDSEVVAEFLAVRRATVGAKASSALSLSLLLEVLREAGAAEEEPVAPEASGAEALLASFRHYLLAERAISAQTADAYLLRARRFMACNAPEGDLAGLQARDVTSAVLAESARVSVGGVQMLVAALRAFLRFCFLEGLLEVDLSGAALAMTGRRRSSLPRGVTASQAAALSGPATGGQLWGDATTPSSWCSCAWASGRARYRRSRSTTSTGGQARSWSTARAAASSGSRCRQTSAKRSPLTWPEDGPTAPAERCSCASQPPQGAWAVGASPSSSGEPAGARA
jgi:hypothetical protein